MYPGPLSLLTGSLFGVSDCFGRRLTWPPTSLQQMYFECNYIMKLSLNLWVGGKLQLIHKNDHFKVFADRNEETKYKTFSATSSKLTNNKIMGLTYILRAVTSLPASSMAWTSILSYQTPQGRNEDQKVLSNHSSIKQWGARHMKHFEKIFNF